MSLKVRRHSRFLVSYLPAFLVLLASGIAFYKVVALGYNLEAVTQSESYHLETVIEFDGHGSPVEISLALPQNAPNQTVSDEAFTSGATRFSVITHGGNRRGVWQANNVTGHQTLGYTATVRTRTQRFVIDSTLPTVQKIAPSIARYLLPDTAVQSDSPVVAALADSLGLSPDSTILFNLTSIYTYATYSLKYVRYSGTTDALTAYHLGEASCGGKSRLMVALARHIGIPARLIGGKILSTGKSKATHIWMEAYINGYWVPFCPTNKYFAEIPSNYLVLYYGEQPVMTHTRDINFKYYFSLKKRLVSNMAALERYASNPLDVLNVWTTFKRVSISLELLKIIIMLPVGILAVVVFRNLVGIETFGTFMPALIAIGFRDTGLGNGIILFGLIMLFGTLVRILLDRLQLLHTPRLAIMLSSIVLFILGMTAFGVNFGLLNVARVTLFPMVILTLTVERLSIIMEEYGRLKAFIISLSTLSVASVAYGLMSWRLLESVVITFPETILLIMAIHIYVGRYSGFRLMEFFRFRHLLARSSG